jgi:hypothetical protein
VSSFAEATAAAAGAEWAPRLACGAALRAQAPSAWREESLRLLLARALVVGDAEEAARLADALPAAVVLEERLVAALPREPLPALAAAAKAPLPARAWRRLLAAGAAALAETTDPLARDLLAAELCASLAHLPPAIAFLEAVSLARCFAVTPDVDDFHLLALTATPGLAAPARADLCLAVGAALASRGAVDEAAQLNAEAARLGGEARP